MELGWGSEQWAGFCSRLPGDVELAVPTPLRVWAEALGRDDAAFSAKGLDSLSRGGQSPVAGPNVRAADLE